MKWQNHLVYIEIYFSEFVKETFSDDWNSDDSYIITSNYFAAF